MLCPMYDMLSNTKTQFYCEKKWFSRFRAQMYCTSGFFWLSNVKVISKFGWSPKLFTYSIQKTGDFLVGRALHQVQDSRIRKDTSGWSRHILEGQRTYTQSCTTTDTLDWKTTWFGASRRKTVATSSHTNCSCLYVLTNYHWSLNSWLPRRRA